jgi:hypothetical protein
VKVATVVALLALLVPAAASARARKYAPPGNSAISQYVESVPTAGGGRPSGTIHTRGAAGSSALSPATQRAFSRQGADGKAAAALANATAPAARRNASAGQRQSPAASASSGGSANESPLDSLLRTATGASSRGGLGAWLPAILIVATLGGGALALRRGLARRST